MTGIAPPVGSDAAFDAGMTANSPRLRPVECLLLGYLGVVTMVKHLQGEQVEKRIDTGVVLVTAENMEKPEINELLHPPLDKYLK